MKASEVLAKALGFCGPNGENWIKGPSDGLPGTMFTGDNVCALLAIERVQDKFNASEDSIVTAGNTLRQAIDDRSVIQWNDAPERTWPEVKLAFETAIVYAEIQEGNQHGIA